MLAHPIEEGGIAPERLGAPGTVRSGSWKGVASMAGSTADHIANGLGLIIDEHDAQYCLVAAVQKALVSELDPAVTAGLLSMVLQCTQTHSIRGAADAAL